MNEFPESPDLKNQCKRAAVLFDLYRKRHRLNSYPTAGFITRDSDANDYDRGHVWTIVRHNRWRYVLDMTLTQFQNYLGLSVPPVLFMPWQEAQRLYAYRPDGLGVYTYYADDVRNSLIEQVYQIP